MALTKTTTKSVKKKTPTKTVRKTPTKSVKKTPTKSVRKTPTKSVRKTPTKSVKKCPVKKTPTKTVKKCPVKKTPTKTVRKTPTKIVKKTPTKTVRKTPLSSLFSGTSSSGECKVGFSRGATGRCEPLPCFDQSGGIIRGISRGQDGGCSLTECGRGTIIDPSTGKCVYINTQLGRSLLPYMYETKARVARAKADRFSQLAPHASDGYAGMYKALSDKREVQYGLAMKSEENAQRIRSEKRSRDIKKIDDKAAYLRARMG